MKLWNYMISKAQVVVPLANLQDDPVDSQLDYLLVNLRDSQQGNHLESLVVIQVASQLDYPVVSPLGLPHPDHQDNRVDIHRHIRVVIQVDNQLDFLLVSPVGGQLVNLRDSQQGNRLESLVVIQVANQRGYLLPDLLLHRAHNQHLNHRYSLVLSQLDSLVEDQVVDLPASLQRSPVINPPFIPLISPV